MTSGTGETLRTRKQRQTREAIHHAALRRVLDEGIDNVTVAEISAEANVSTRTFFNYFPTKEDAVLGLPEEIADDDAIEAFIDRECSSGDLVTDVSHLVRSVFAVTPNGETFERIREAMTRHPQLRRRQLQRVTAIEQRLSRTVAGHLRTDHRFSDGDVDVDDAARVIVMVCSSAMRLAIQNATRNDAEAGSAETAEHAFDQAVELLRKVIRKLQ
ncbi:TetR/AcrR family transcriptional regulator [Actinorugispora endophytica]|uniref:TetR family transcriptional regulator n=1 Tax=Actinorugispora endophytica TaxID=1605990 RepID=A0A4R6V966_9ACTN|nr:TetR/AcrR family transcriptional regulator [Actinorugispora endophytica]TDQ52978.1 TetR family transcriptional regulator [Actinorugispora endophytica]